MPQGVGGVPPQPGPAPVAQAGGMTENVASALCYLAGIITGIIFLVLAPYNQSKIVRFHAFQSIFFSIAWIILSVAISILSAILLAMSSAIGILISLFHLVLGLGGLLLWLFLMWKAYNNQKFVLPIVGPLAEKQA